MLLKSRLSTSVSSSLETSSNDFLASLSSSCMETGSFDDDSSKSFSDHVGGGISVSLSVEKD
jgi:hypothetical protein